VGGAFLPHYGLYVGCIRGEKNCIGNFSNLVHGHFGINKYFQPRTTRTEMYAGRVACCSLVSHVEYAPRALLRLEKKGTGRTDRRTDGRTDVRPLHYALRWMRLQ